MPLLRNDMKLATYTKAEGMVLEDHYIEGYKKEGLWGAGKVPSNESMHRKPFNVTPAGKARMRKATESKEVAYSLIRVGHKTVREVATIMRRTDTPVRRYFRLLEKEGRIRMETVNACGKATWTTT